MRRYRIQYADQADAARKAMTAAARAAFERTMTGRAVRAQASGGSFTRWGKEPPEVPVRDVLVALTGG
ncbi:hypothetical protein [Streptomyces sp. NBC_00872]|uniref:hypothetical protein n=1 Tax=Streptomyces sp. NBC_00872 TaxID=2903686 RepID=UPI003867D3A0|nr:hypothetical protein OG214_34775 [Streptomyces sp. NBC_00872]